MSLYTLIHLYVAIVLLGSVTINTDTFISSDSVGPSNWLIGSLFNAVQTAMAILTAMK